MQCQTELDQWLKWSQDSEANTEVTRLSEEDPESLCVSMRPRIAFGTAGLRAEMGPGFAKMNDLTVLQTAQGLAKYVKQTDEANLKRGIVIGHDHRHNSQRYAELTVLAFSQLGFNIHYLGLVHTPSVPFSIDKFDASCGVMVTASHNPAKDNGYKVYWGNGCQIVPPVDAGIADSILENLEPWSWDLGPIQALLKPVNVFDDYFDSFRSIKYQSKSEFKFVYTAMHGVGLPYATRAAELLGLSAEQFLVVEEQAKPDPDFSTVKFPNPEEKGALDLAYKTADRHGVSFILANDPDADRFSFAAKHPVDGWKQLKGDEVGLLLANYLIKQKKTRADGKYCALNSLVSSQQLGHLCQHHSVLHRETLTGFKWLGNEAINLEKDGYTTILAYEEALGYMVGSIHDKDGVSALSVFIQLVNAIDGKVFEELDAIAKQIGYFAQYNSYFKVSPALSSQYLSKLHDALESKKIGSLNVSKATDKGSGMYVFEFEDTRASIRGSGTEPKIKLYIESKSDSYNSAAKRAKEVWDELGAAFFADLEPEA